MPQANQATHSGYRSEIQGLRTIAALLIAVHHIWINRVSGGVDVFFVISGFLITGTLVREIERTERIRIGAYLTRLARRLFPAAWVVLAVSATGILALVSKVYWESHFADVRAATLYTANLRLAETSVDYLAQDVPKSPVQHFWAMSIQGQFYLVWPFLVGVGWRMSRLLRRPGIAGVAIVLSLAAVASFAYSVLNTPRDPTVMYFNTYARVWEFAVGGLLALGLPRIRLIPPVADAVGAAGLVSLLLTGVVTGGMAFPGWVALVPVVAAVGVISAGNSERPGLAMRLLRSRPLVAAGDYSYAFFLWHWPILILGLAWSDSLRASVPGGIAVIVGAATASWLTVRLIERPFLRLRSGAEVFPLPREWALASLALVALLVGSKQVERHMFGSLKASADTTVPFDPTGTTLPPRPRPPKAVESLFDPGAPIVPDPLLANKDLPLPRRDGCIDPKDPPPGIVPCVYGRRGGPSIALVGGSHAIQWLDALDGLGKRHGWEIRLIGRPGCRFGMGYRATCDTWTKRVREYLVANPPDAVFTTGTAARKQRDYVGTGYIAEWSRLDDAGIPVITVRDNPEFIDPVPACVEAHRGDPSKCAVARNRLLSPVDPMESEPNLPSNVTHLDLTEYWCTSVSCLAVVDNVLVYRDRHHFTATFVSTMIPALERELLPIMERIAESTVRG